MSSSGAPRNIAGMKSMNVCVIAIEVMKIKIIVMGNWVSGIEIMRIVAMRFMWMPGISPVIVPAKIPNMNVKINSII